jgi:hypothetical protein
MTAAPGSEPVASPFPVSMDVPIDEQFPTPAPTRNANPSIEDSSEQYPAKPASEWWHSSLLFQGWYGNGLGDRIAGNNGINPIPQGRNYGMDGVSAFRLRRAQVAFDIFPRGREINDEGKPYELYPARNFDFHLMFDLARAFDGSTHRQVLQDLTVGYQFDNHFRLEVGQQKTGLTEEGTRDDSRLLTIARSVMSEDVPAIAGRQGDSRDFGLVLRYHYPVFQGFLGIWDDNGATQNRQDNNSQKFVNGAFYYTGIPHLKVGVWGGMNVLGSTPGERRDRGGATFIWQHGPHYLEGEIAYGRDYAAGAPSPGRNGSISRGSYWLYAHTISRKWQLVARYEHWDPAQQNFTGPDPITETGIPILRANHKLHEYTLGVNYYLPHDSKLQFNLIREDTEENGGVFFGKKRTVFLINFQTGLNAPTRPEPLAGTYDDTGKILTSDTNGLRLGLLTGPHMGLAVGVDVYARQLKLLPGFRSRGTIDFLGEFNAPNFFGTPGTIYTMTGDQITVLRGNLYGGFGLGAYFDGKLMPGSKFFIGTRVMRNVGLEFTTHFPDFGRPSFSLQTRVPL